MAFNNLGFGTLAPGQSTRWWYSFGGGDHGLQIAGGHPLNPGGNLLAYDQSKARNNDGTTTYWVSIRNIGSVTTNFSIQGGGAS